MLDERALNDLIGRTYDAAMGDEDWAVLLERTTRAVGGMAAGLRWHGRPAAQAITIDMDRACHQSYAAYYHGLDPIWPKMRRLPPGTAVDDCALVPVRELEGTEIYNDLLIPNRIHVGLSWYCLDPAGQPVALKIVRSRRQPVYADQELRVLSALAPHLTRAVAIEGRLATVAARRIAVRLSRQRAELSPRERECLARVARGATSKGIARQLELSAYTVDEHIGSAMRKLQASSRSEAVATALALGLLIL
ncbi:helix-turn-helix transcriptional regulator [Inquilinus sp. Marseille-Q2685]|uniref:helix-turn-helix domain-containing protein n=1 Tax=Inquilinus sp. Marseille-Q2685 TaxID=2866581 RepID=UPI001CE3B694|nr:helix-turn-helix transcriptional regulator [Inquilinus sp. Marseille-Q2685]